MMTKTRILVADDHAMFRQGLKALLESEGYDVVAEATNGHEAVRLAREYEPDVCILDVSMPGSDGIEAAAEIYEHVPGTCVIALTMFEADAYVLKALRAKIRGYVLKSQAASDCVAAIREVLRGSVYLSPGISETVVAAYRAKSLQPHNPLTERERQVVQLVAEGKSTKAIGQILNISVKTAESHRTRMMQKLSIHRTAGLVRYAIRQGLIEA